MVALKPDAFIMADPGVIDLVREEFQKPLFIFRYKQITSTGQVQSFGKNGISRIILSRELSLKEIAEIHEHNPHLEIECFVHGAICMAYSGRCLLSNYFSYRDANQGTCTFLSMEI